MEKWRKREKRGRKARTEKWQHLERGQKWGKRHKKRLENFSPVKANPPIFPPQMVVLVRHGATSTHIPIPPKSPPNRLPLPSPQTAHFWVFISSPSSADLNSTLNHVFHKLTHKNVHVKPYIAISNGNTANKEKIIIPCNLGFFPALKGPAPCRVRQAAAADFWVNYGKNWLMIREIQRL